MVLALPELLALAGLFLALGMVVMGDQFTRALFQVTASGVGWIPWIGKKAANGVQAVGQRVNAVFSSAAMRLEGAISRTWHVLAYLIDQTGQAIWEATEVAARALYAWEVQLPLKLAQAVARAGHSVTTKVHTTVRPLVKNYYTTTGASRAQLARLGQRIGRLEARVRAAAIAVPAAVTLPLPRIGSLERVGSGTKARLGKLEARFGRKAFAASVAAALATLGVSWARKSCAKRTADGFCTSDLDFLGDLFAGLLLIVGSISLLDLARGYQEITGEVSDASRAFIREASAADSKPRPRKGLDAFNISTQKP